MAILDVLRRRLGRPPHQPQRETRSYPQSAFGGSARITKRAVTKPTPRNLRHFSRTPYARRAINAVKNPIAMLEWEIVPIRGVEMNSELERQAQVVRRCFEQPNTDDSFRTMTEQVVEDILCGAGALEVQIGGDGLRPLWLYPADGLSIQLYPAWSGEAADPRYAQIVGRGVKVELRNDELIYFKANPSTATPFGLGPLEVAFLSISRQLGVGDFAGEVSSNARPSILMDLGEGVDPEKLKVFRDYWTNEIEGQGKLPIVGTKGGAVQRMYPEGDSALFLAYQEFLKTEIAVAFDLSPMNLGVERDVNRNTAEVSEGRDWDQAIKPMADLYSAHLTREAIQGRLGFSQLQLRFPELDAEDEGSLSETYGRDYVNNLVSPNEHRARRGLPPSDSPFAGLLKCEADIAIQAAKGAAEVLDPKLNPPALPAPKKG